MNDHQEDSVASRKGRALEKLKRDLGQEFLQKFLNPNLLEVMCNPNEDGSSSIFWEEQGQDMVYDPEMSKRFNSSRAESPSAAQLLPANKTSLIEIGRASCRERV